MCNKKSIPMVVSGEFLTNLARTWLWEEKRPTQSCINFLVMALDLDMDKARDIAIQILEGRKKLVGNNVFTLEDDNEQIRPIMNLTQDLEKENLLLKIQMDMQTNFQKYVDIWATVKSSHPNALQVNGNPTTYPECVDWYCKDNSRPPEHLMMQNMRLLDTPTMGGLWLIREPETVYECCQQDMKDIGKPDFWERIYQMVQDRTGFEDRNQRYLFSKRPKQSYEERMKALYQVSLKEIQNEPEYLSPEWFLYHLEHDKDITYRLEPDDMQNWEGLIAPNGDFYSCKFGGHNEKAFYLLLQHPEWVQSTKEALMDSKEIRIDNSLDVLIKLGWCATRSVMQDDYVLPAYPKRPTKAQINRIYDAVIKHDASVNTQELLNQLS